jgi:hypothetical protein
VSTRLLLVLAVAEGTALAVGVSLVLTHLLGDFMRPLAIGV